MHALIQVIKVDGPDGSNAHMCLWLRRRCTGWSAHSHMQLYMAGRW